MQVLSFTLRISLVCCGLLAGLSLHSCNQTLTQANNGLKPGLNYMQPMRWKLTYRYRIKLLVPYAAYNGSRMSAIDPSIPAVGKGTWEVWFVEPREGEELRNLELVNTSIQPTATTTSDEDVTLFYYDLAPDGYLPREAQISLTWTFTTLERYAFWEGMQYGAYDTQSEFFKQYTKEDPPIQLFGDLRKTVNKLTESDGDDVVKKALHCYNFLLDNFTYDDSQEADIMYNGAAATIDAFRCWQNRYGVCDEFASVLCSMLRSAQIPSRPACGIVHNAISAQTIRDQYGYEVNDADLPKGLLLIPGGHAWVEYYLPDVGWIPVDATWGQESNEMPVSWELSTVGAQRSISFADYYYGKNDPYRIPLYKTYNIKLDPAPKTPKAKSSEFAFIGCTERKSGVKKVVHGYDGVASVGVMGWSRSADAVGTNIDYELEILGPPSATEIAELKAQVEKEGAHYLAVEPVKADWPFFTTGDDQFPEPPPDEAQ